MFIQTNIFDIPDAITINRNGFEIVGVRHLVAQNIEITGGFTLGDKDGIGLFDLIQCVAGRYNIHKYVWIHDQLGPINLGIVIANQYVSKGSISEYHLNQRYAPHIDTGIPVDSAAIKLLIADMQFDFDSGLGDGVYPVWQRRQFFKRPNAIAVDFLLWKVRKVIVWGKFVLDKYGIAVEKSA